MYGFTSILESFTIDYTVQSHGPIQSHVPVSARVTESATRRRLTASFSIVRGHGALFVGMVLGGLLLAGCSKAPAPAEPTAGAPESTVTAPVAPVTVAEAPPASAGLAAAPAAVEPPATESPAELQARRDAVAADLQAALTALAASTNRTREQLIAEGLSPASNRIAEARLRSTARDLIRERAILDRALEGDAAAVGQP
jgi:hypothetical protein